VNVCPPTVIAADRPALLGFAVKLNPTEPDPVPDAVVVSVSHAAFEPAVHAQSVAVAVNVKPPVPATEPAASDGVPSVNEHPTPA